MVYEFVALVGDGHPAGSRLGPRAATIATGMATTFASPSDKSSRRRWGLTSICYSTGAEDALSVAGGGISTAIPQFAANRLALRYSLQGIVVDEIINFSRSEMICAPDVRRLQRLVLISLQPGCRGHWYVSPAARCQVTAGPK
jgi:hypothetical protein